MAQNVWKWVKMNGMAGNGWKWLEMGENDLTWLAIAGNGWNAWKLA